MTFGELKAEVLREAGENPALPRFWTAAEAGEAVNRAQLAVGFLTLCFEGTGTLTHPGGMAAVDPGATFADWIAPLRVRLGNVRLMPGSLAEFAAENPLWPSLPNNPERYAMEGWNQMWLYPRPAAQVSLDVRYARNPAVLTLDAASPELAVEYHPALVEYAVVCLRAKEGGSELAKVLPNLKSFLGSVRKLADETRRRAVAQHYDTQPAERYFQLLEAGQWPSTAAK